MALAWYIATSPFLQERRRVLPSIWISGNADADRDWHLMATKIHWGGDADHHLGRDLARFAPSPDSRQKHDEFIATHARDGIGSAHRVPDALRGHAQNLIAGSMSQRVIYLLETVQVHHQQCKRGLPAPGGFEFLIQPFVQQRARDQAG